MDSERFDAVLRTLASGTSRRGALAGLIGLAGLGLSDVAARRRHQGGKHRGKAKGSNKAASQGAKVTICHQTGSETHPFQVITVSANAVPTHEAHGDLVHCPNLQIIDFAACTCICPVEEIACEQGQRLDRERCACVSGSGTCIPAECSSQNNACTTCSCRHLGSDSGCVCGTKVCSNGACDPETGCP